MATRLIRGSPHSQHAIFNWDSFSNETTGCFSGTAAYAKMPLDSPFIHHTQFPIGTVCERDSRILGQPYSGQWDSDETGDSVILLTAAKCSGMVVTQPDPT